MDIVLVGHTLKQENVNRRTGVTQFGMVGIIVPEFGYFPYRPGGNWDIISQWKISNSNNGP